MKIDSKLLLSFINLDSNQYASRRRSSSLYDYEMGEVAEE